MDNPCRYYYEIHPVSSCDGYRAPALRKSPSPYVLPCALTLIVVTGVGDPHIDTIDNGRYTCHIQGVYIFAQTNIMASRTAQANLLNTNAVDSNLIYPDDLFYIHVRSSAIPPALPFVERAQGSASVFSSYVIGAGNFTFEISNQNGKFGKVTGLAR